MKAGAGRAKIKIDNKKWRGRSFELLQSRHELVHNFHLLFVSHKTACYSLLFLPKNKNTMELFSTCHGATNCQCFPADRWQRVGALKNDEIYCSSGRKSFTTTKPGRNQQVHVWPRPLNSLDIFSFPLMYSLWWCVHTWLLCCNGTSIFHCWLQYP